MGTSSSSYVPPALPNKYYNPEYVGSLPSMEGKVVVVTGASTTTGLGWIAAKTLALKGARIILLNRNSERAVDAEAQLKAAVPGAAISTINCDLSSFQGTQSAADELKEQLKNIGIDVLCNNAGVMALKDAATADGYDVQMQTNHLSHFLLTREVFPLLEKAVELRGEARIVNHSSGARKMGGQLQAKYLGKNGGNLGGDSSSMFFGGARWTRYGQTKLANVVFTLALRDKLTKKSSRVKALCATPGLAATQLQVTHNIHPCIPYAINWQLYRSIHSNLRPRRIVMAAWAVAPGSWATARAPRTEPCPSSTAAPRNHCRAEIAWSRVALPT